MPAFIPPLALLDEADRRQVLGQTATSPRTRRTVVTRPQPTSSRKIADQEIDRIIRHWVLGICCLLAVAGAIHLVPAWMPMVAIILAVIAQMARLWMAYAVLALLVAGGFNPVLAFVIGFFLLGTESEKKGGK